jgi:hypothetical protein
MEQFEVKQMKYALELKELPQYCCECPAFREAIDFDPPWCAMTLTDINSRECNIKRNDDCPIIRIE